MCQVTHPALVTRLRAYGFTVTDWVPGCWTLRGPSTLTAEEVLAFVCLVQADLARSLPQMA